MEAGAKERLLRFLVSPVVSSRRQTLRGSRRNALVASFPVQRVMDKHVASDAWDAKVFCIRERRISSSI